ncbi:MAG: cupin domain-containing protein [Rhodospirillaceae bacterium]|nr:cupin domain-containing protein [Rhodospirillaceae bacterium]
MNRRASQAEMEDRLVRYADLKPCTNAFIDSRTPGSDRKENFTIIGPGVAENPDQHVHIRIPHGFNIGGARQPPGCTNSQHSHETAEVFVIHRGGFRFKTGEHGTSGHVDLGPGDVISIPTHAFRGFDTLGTEDSFMFSVLGGDDPGRVMWAPYVFDAARKHGLVLLADGRLIDTSLGQTVPQGARVMPPTTADDAARLKVLDSAGIASCTVRRSDLKPAPTGPFARLEGVNECPVVGAANPAESMPPGKLAWSHGFHVRALHIAPGAAIPAHVRHEEEVLLVHAGHLQLAWDDGHVDVTAGDTLTVPKELKRAYRNLSALRTEVYVVRGGDYPSAPTFA